VNPELETIWLVPPEEDRKKIGFELKEEQGKYRKKTRADNA